MERHKCGRTEKTKTVGMRKERKMTMKGVHKNAVEMEKPCSRQGHTILCEMLNVENTVHVEETLWNVGPNRNRARIVVFCAERRNA